MLLGEDIEVMLEKNYLKSWTLVRIVDFKVPTTFILMQQPRKLL